MSSYLLNTEANYQFCLGRYETSPTETRKREIAKKQILIDQRRRDERLPLRWFTSAELKDVEDDSDAWPSEPRQPLALAEEFAELPTLVKYQGETTMTLDTLLAELLELRKTHSGQTPVTYVMQDGYYEYCERHLSITGTTASAGCIRLDNI
jgi:hypothetical protein